MRLSLVYTIVLLSMLGVSLYIVTVVTSLASATTSPSQIIGSLYCILSNKSLCMVTGPVQIREVTIDESKLCLLDLGSVVLLADTVNYSSGSTGVKQLCPGGNYSLTNISLVYVEWHKSSGIVVTLYSG